MIFVKDVIASRNNPTVKWAASLKEKKGRNENGAFMIEGEKLSFEAMAAGLPVTHVFISEEKTSIVQRIKEYEHLKNTENTQVFILKKEAFEKISTEIAPQGIISIIKHLDFFRHSDIIYKEEFSSDKCEKVIILCSVRDPGNLGAVIRSSVAFGIDHIVMSEDCADIYNPKTVRGAMGSLFHVKVTSVKDLASSVQILKDCGRRVFAAELVDNAVSLSDIRVLKSDVFVIGNEGHGIDKDVSKACSNSVYIPICSETESLNASVAAAVFMWEQSKIV